MTEPQPSEQYESAIGPSCIDCGLLYEEFGLDSTLPDEQWLMIHPEGEGGILCANCMVRRASSLAGAVAIRMYIDFVNPGNDRIRYQLVRPPTPNRSWY